MITAKEALAAATKAEAECVTDGQIDYAKCFAKMEAEAGRPKPWIPPPPDLSFIVDIRK